MILPQDFIQLADLTKQSYWGLERFAAAQTSGR